MEMRKETSGKALDKVHDVRLPGRCAEANETFVDRAMQTDGAEQNPENGMDYRGAMP